MTDQPLISVEQAERDADLRDDVRRRIYNDTIIRESHVSVDVSVADGVVTLDGAVLSAIMHDRVLYRAATTPGVKKVIDNVHSDPEIELAVMQALATHPDLQAGPSLDAVSYRGAVRLYGDVQTDEQRSLVVSVVKDVPGIQQVVDDLQVKNTND